MIKVLFLIDTLDGGGAEKVLRTLVNNLDQDQFEITVQTVESADPTNYLAPGIRYKAINRCRTALGKKLYSYWIRLCAEAKWLYPLYIKGDYDIEVAYLECGPTKMLSGSTNKTAKKLAWVHCDLTKKPGVLESLEKQSKYYRAYDKVICVSQSVKDSFVSLFGTTPESLVLYNVVDEQDILNKAAAFDPGKYDCFTFLSVGRLSHQKGYDRLLEACKLLKEDGCEFHLQILGTGPEEAALKAMAEEYDLCNQVSFLGFQENPYPYMKAADAIVCASRCEGFSTVVTEALILGKPVVTTPCSGMQELLGDSQYGLITKDSVDGIYAGMKQLLENPGLREQYQQAAALRGKQFSKAVTVNKEENFFRELLSQ